MTYQTPHRIAVLSFIENGGSKTEASNIFKVSRAIIYNWLKLDNIEPNAPLSSRNSKINKAKLLIHVVEHPDMFLRERAAIFGVHLSSMGHALAKLKIVKKRKSDI